MSTSAQAGQPARQVRDCFNWNDPNNYQWTLWLPHADTAELVGYLLAAAVIFPLMIYGFFFGIACFSEETAYWICTSISALLLIGIIFSIVAIFRGKERERKQARSSSYFFAVMLLGCLMRFSTIRHGQDWLSQSLTVLVRLLITVGLVELILEYYRTRFFKQHFYSTVQECYYHLSAFPDPSQLQLRCEGRVTALPEAREFPVTQFVDAFKQLAEKPA